MPPESLRNGDIYSARGCRAIGMSRRVGADPNEIDVERATGIEPAFSASEAK